VIVGHSERRADHGETDADVRAKAEAALAVGLGVIVCVGETEAQRDAGNAEAIVARSSRLAAARRDAAEKVSVAYEPVWAIGTGRTPRSTMSARCTARSAHGSRRSTARAGRKSHPLRRFGQARQRRRTARRGRSRRGAGRRGEPDRRELPRDHRRRAELGERLSATCPEAARAYIPHEHVQEFAREFACRFSSSLPCPGDRRRALVGIVLMQRSEGGGLGIGGGGSPAA
jgi:hypothetical protein